MKQTGYLQWAVENTNTVWWHDSAEPSEIERGIQRGAVGATTNPFLSHLALSLNKDAWAKDVDRVLSEQAEPERKAEQLMSIAITHAANQLEFQYEKSKGRRRSIPPERQTERACFRWQDVFISGHPTLPLSCPPRRQGWMCLRTAPPRESRLH